MNKKKGDNLQLFYFSNIKKLEFYFVNTESV